MHSGSWLSLFRVLGILSLNLEASRQSSVLFKLFLFNSIPLIITFESPPLTLHLQLLAFNSPSDYWHLSKV